MRTITKKRRNNGFRNDELARPTLFFIENTHVFSYQKKTKIKIKNMEKLLTKISQKRQYRNLDASLTARNFYFSKSLFLCF